MYDKNKHYHKNQYFMTKNTIKFLYVLGQQQFKNLNIVLTVCVQLQMISRVFYFGHMQGRPPPKIGKNIIFLRKIVIFHTKFPKKFRAALRNWKKYDFLA